MTPTWDSASGDAALVDAARAGDRTAMEQLLARHYDRIHAICRRITANTTDADDAAQETLIKIVRSLDRFDRRSSVSTWIHRIATNTALDEIRRRRRRPALSAVADPGSETEHVDERASAEIDGLASQMLLDEAIARLPDDQRAAVVLRDAIGLDYQQIAEVLEIAPGTVKSRISRARQRLMTDLANHVETETVAASGDTGNQTAPAERLSTSPNDEHDDRDHPRSDPAVPRDGSNDEMRAHDDGT